ncbi:LysR family transcriptional regulator [Achromobacter xylosoxidans]|uniref:LysR family transcriptional regulator n=1 Tax=Alcaligenes xylosoxydans xylosoxydans TaxID=85698 RepID=UPI00047EEF2A|nr:LysR family transcriptional regulator [Achromobacter xylosoxidans]MBK1979448.1 LysR family transcriptional regulator [Achromobacter xylosoxidans]MCH4596063.1 LysR family transcriptional regulator [Achromobacter xylosoxidans]MCM2570701.1 LysR family transcriptional regulator [Achromobacter xylosoxidans]MCZ8385167.1 LysR family transcriptional regulator [Achromobacter xylosoxidans]MEC6413253.1 LysR family transcriptional regulator [Achromobacter xylosoxidans]
MDTPDRQLRYFVRIAELKSLSRAAEDLDQTQSGLSRQLAALEAHVGKPLFVRTGRGVELTEAGARLLDGILPAYRSIDQTLEAVRQREGVTQGSVRLATVHTLSYYFMAEVVAQFVSSREHVNLSVMGRSSPEVVALVESGKADIGFVYDAAVASDALASTPLFDDDMCLIVRHGVAVEDGADLAAMPLRLVGFPPHYALRKMIHSAGLQPEFVAEAETIDAMLKLVSSGVGACILPSRIPDKLLADYGLRKVVIRQPVLRRRVVAITLAQRPPLPLVRELLDCARRIARD